IEGTAHAQGIIESFPDSRLIDDEFLKKYYSAERTKGLAGEFKGRESKVIVLLPNIEIITNDICKCLANFVNVVTENPVYREILNDKSTIVNYYGRVVDD
ncbi:MAG: hypothetical protein ABI353_13820, partial [Isosphaeraceae bacterium]